MFENKRGQGLSTNTIILIILGVLILVILILAFTGVFGDMGKYFKPSNNVKDIVNSCASQCSLKDRYDFCNVNKTLKTEDAKYIGTCYTFSLSDEFKPVGVEPCAAVDCSKWVACADWTYQKDKNQVPVSIDGVAASKTSGRCS